jgi:MFS transporter, DHA2 family, methylenomycin A resistance protein
MTSLDSSQSVPAQQGPPVGDARVNAPARPAMPLRPLIALSLGYFLVMLDVTVVNVAVPAIRSSVHGDTTDMQWIVDGYSTFFAGLLLLGGGLGDRLGHRRLFLTGLALFAAASIGCAAAPNVGVLIGSRLAQGAGAALLVPASFALLQAAYPDRAQRSRAMGIWGLVSAFAFGLGPAVGGMLVSGLSWRWAFWVNLPFSALCAIAAVRYVPSPARRRRTDRLDVAGVVLGIIGLVGVAGALNEAGSNGWLSSTVLGGFAIGVVALVAFISVELRLERSSTRTENATRPLLPPGVFRTRRLTATNAIGLLLSFGYYGLLFVATLYFQQERGYSPLLAGFSLLPSVCMGFIAAPLSSRLTARYGPYVPICGALALGSLGFLGWLAAGPHTAYPVLLFALMATGLATPVSVVASTIAVMEATPAEHAGVSSAVFNVSRQVGSAIGVALFGTLAGTAAKLVGGLHTSAVIAACAFALGSLVALTTQRARRTS